MYGALEGDVVLGCLSTFVQSVSRILKLPKLKLSGSGKMSCLGDFFSQKNLCKSHQVIQVSVHNDYDMTPQKKNQEMPSGSAESCRFPLFGWASAADMSVFVVSWEYVHFLKPARSLMFLRVSKIRHYNPIIIYYNCIVSQYIPVNIHIVNDPDVKS